MRQFLEHTGPVLSVDYSPDGRYLASGSWDRTFCVWDVQEGRVTEVVDTGSPVLDLCFSPDGLMLLTRDNHNVRLWRRRPNHRWRVLDGPSAEWQGAWLFSPDSASVLCDRPTGRQSRLCCVGLPGGGVRSAVSLPGPLRDLTASRDGARLAALTGESQPRLVLLQRSAGDGALQNHWQEVSRQRELPRCLAIHPAGAWVAVGEGRQVRLWELGDREVRAHAPLEGHGETVMGVAFSPDGRSLMSASLDGQVMMWDVASRSRREGYDWQISTVRAVQFAPDGMTAAAGGFDNSVMVWDVE